MTPYPGTDLCNNWEKYGITIEDSYWYEKKDWFKKPIAWVWTISANRLVDIVKEAYINYLS